jgi:hypothetical protein
MWNIVIRTQLRLQHLFRRIHESSLKDPTPAGDMIRNLRIIELKSDEDISLRSGELTDMILSILFLTPCITSFYQRWYKYPIGISPLMCLARASSSSLTSLGVNISMDAYGIFPAINALTSLKVLHLTFEGYHWDHSALYPLCLPNVNQVTWSIRHESEDADRQSLLGFLARSSFKPKLFSLNLETSSLSGGEAQLLLPFFEKHEFGEIELSQVPSPGIAALMPIIMSVADQVTFDRCMPDVPTLKNFELGKAVGVRYTKQHWEEKDFWTLLDRLVSSGRAKTQRPKVRYTVLAIMYSGGPMDEFTWDGDLSPAFIERLIPIAHALDKKGIEIVDGLNRSVEEYQAECQKASPT